MLRISPETQQSLEGVAQEPLRKRIDAWLTMVETDWNQLGAQFRLAQLDRVLAEARRAAMVSERDFAVFCWICFSIGPDWEQKLSEGRVHSFLESDEFRAEAKLMKLSDIFGLAG